MKRLTVFWLTAGLTLCLAACHGEPPATPTPQRTEPSAAEVTPASTVEPDPTPTDTAPEIYAEVPMLAAHLSSEAEGVTPTEEGNYSGYYAIGGAEVTEAEFDVWLEEIFFTEDAVWHPAREKRLEPWQAVYVEVMREERKQLDTSQTWEGYHLYDIDKDGIPELLFFYEDVSTPETWHIYTYRPYQSKNAVFLGEFFLSHEEWHTYPEGNGLLKYWCQMGAREVTLYTLEGNELKEVQMFPDTVPQPDDLMEALFPRAETIPGRALCADLKEWEDYSLLVDYPASNFYGRHGESVELSRADFLAYDQVLSPGEREAVESFLPVLTGKEPLIPDWNDGKIFLTDWFKELLSSESGEFPSVFNAFALCDLDGDGAREMILWIDGYGGCYTILHREKGTVYGTYMSVRQFHMLQTNGVYAATGGMGDQSYYRAYFEDGKLLERQIGYTSYSSHNEPDTVHYFVEEREVSEEEFEVWREETLTGDAVWYAARENKEEA